MKQVIVVRKDLKMRKGKLAAQVAHASLAAVLPNQEDHRVVEWLASSFTKIVVGVDTEVELSDVYTSALAEGMIAAPIIDNGTTEFHGEKTFTCVAIGPDEDDKFLGVTSTLELL